MESTTPIIEASCFLKKCEPRKQFHDVPNLMFFLMVLILITKLTTKTFSFVLPLLLFLDPDGAIVGVGMLVHECELVSMNKGA